MLEVKPAGQRGCTAIGSGQNGREHIVSPPSGRHLVRTRPVVGQIQSFSVSKDDCMHGVKTPVYRPL